MKTRINFYYVQIVFQILVAACTIPWGFMFIRDTTGHLCGVSQDMLDSTPFVDFLFTGLFLAAFIGGGNVISIIVTWLRVEVSGFLGILFGIILIIWMILQIYWIGIHNPLQPVLIVLGAIQTVIGYKLLRDLLWGA